MLTEQIPGMNKKRGQKGKKRAGFFGFAASVINYGRGRTRPCQ